MSKIKTRAEAREASRKKWADILQRIYIIQVDAETMCGFCELAKERAKDVKGYMCTFCEPDARKLCNDYINEERLIPDTLETAYEYTDKLLKKIRSLPVDLK